MKTIREILFRGMRGCTNHGCVINKIEGIATNGTCSCIQNMSRSQLQILQSRLSLIIDKKITIWEQK